MLLREKGEIRDKGELGKPNWPRLSPSVYVTSKIKMPSKSLVLFHLCTSFIFDTDSLFPQYNAFVVPCFMFALLATGLLVIIFSFVLLNFVLCNFL